jgi:hypothetical protein
LRVTCDRRTSGYRTTVFSLLPSRFFVRLPVLLAMSASIVIVAATAGVVQAETASGAGAGPESAPTEPLRIPSELVEGHLRVGFNVLGGFPFELTKAEAAAAASPEAVAEILARVPAEIRALDGRKVLVTGFMLPMQLEGPLTTEFLLVATSMLCCYGVVPPMNQWIVVKMVRGGVKPQQDVPLSFFGTLRVQPRYDSGALSAIYQLEGERMHVPRSE